MPGNLDEANLAGIIPRVFIHLLLIQKRSKLKLRYFSLSILFILTILPKSKSQTFFSSQDSLQIIALNYDELSIILPVNTNHTLENIADHYGLTPIQLKKYNAGLTSETISDFIDIHIPIPKEAIRILEPLEGAEFLFHPIYYEVKAGETLYHLSKRVFNQSQDSLISRNSLEDISLSRGQKLLIGWLSKQGIPRELQKERLQIQTTENLKNQRLFENQINKQSKIETEQGSVLKITENKSRDLVCLHRSLKRGTIIKVQNPMNNRILYLKVIGQIPAHHDVKFKLLVPEYVADLLVGLDNSFYVVLEY